MSQQKKQTVDAGPAGFRFGLPNYVAFALAVISIVAGYVLLDQGSVTAAPFLLIVGYAVLIPVGLMLGWKRIG